MKKTFIAVRDVDEDAYNRLRARAIRERAKVGKVLTKAIERYLEGDASEEKARPDPKNLLNISGIIKTKGKVRWSEEVDDILYG